MFSGLATAEQNPIRRWTAMASFTLQAAVVAAGLVYPLVHPDTLPRVVHPLFLPLTGDSNPVQPERSVSHGGNSAAVLPIVVNPHGISFTHTTTEIRGSGPAPAPDIVGLPSDGNGEGVIHSILSEHMQPVPHVAVPQQAFRRSVVMEGNLIRRVEPQYPVIAKQLHIQGTVILKAYISREGTIEHLQVESGQPLLVRAAVEAVKQWRYRPYFLNNVPIEVETEVTVKFVLQ